MRSLVEGEATGSRRRGLLRLPAARAAERTTRGAQRVARTQRVGSSAELEPGAHLVTPRRGFTHHGIYVGAGRVVHYAGLARSLQRGPVEEVSFEEFAGGHVVAVRLEDPAIYPAAAIVARARSRLGEDRYRVTTNNCEHFCEWCLRGESRSAQVERFIAWPRAAARAGVRALRLLGRFAPRAARAGAV